MNEFRPWSVVAKGSLNVSSAGALPSCIRQCVAGCPGAAPEPEHEEPRSSQGPRFPHRVRGRGQGRSMDGRPGSTGKEAAYCVFCVGADRRIAEVAYRVIDPCFLKRWSVYISAAPIIDAVDSANPYIYLCLYPFVIAKTTTYQKGCQYIQSRGYYCDWWRCGGRYSRDFVRFSGE